MVCFSVTEVETIGTWAVSVVQPVQMQTLWKENCLALLQKFVITHTWQFTWLFSLHAHRMDRTRVLLRWYQAWGSKGDKVVWAPTTKDLVLIKVIKHIVCSPVSASPQRGAVPVQCTQGEMAGTQCRALAERKASRDVGWDIQGKFSQKRCLMWNVSHMLSPTVWTRASWSDLETVTEICCDLFYPSRRRPWATQPSPGPAVGPAARAEQRRPRARPREGNVPRGAGLEWWQGQQGHARPAGPSPRFPRWLRPARRLPGWFPPR